MDFQLSPEQRDLQNLVRTIAQEKMKPLAPRWDRTHAFPWESIRALARAGVLGLTIPEPYGGVGAGTARRGVGAVLIDRDTPGLEVGRCEVTLGGELLFPVYFRDVRLPPAAVLVKEHGFRKLMTAFNGQRCLNAAISLGQAQGAFDEALGYVQTRRQFGQRLADFQGIQWSLADMAIELDAARLLIYRAACNARAGLPDQVEAAKAKAFANETA